MSDLSHTVPSTDAQTDADLEKLDDLLAQLGVLQLQILREMTVINTEHQEIDQRHASSLDPKLKKAQDLFNKVQALADPRRKTLLGKGRSKTHKRQTGDLSWRSQPRLEVIDNEEDVISALRTLGAKFSRKFIRKTTTYELNKTALLDARFRKLVEDIPGLVLHLGDDFVVTPSGGLRMSTANPYWPTLEGVPGPTKLKEILEG